MDRKSITLSAVITTAILLANGGAVAQSGRPAPERDDLAVEIFNEGNHGSQFPVVARPGGGMMQMGPGRQLPGWKQPEGALPLTQLRFRALMEGESVRVRVFAVFDDSWPVDAPGPKYGPREQFVASYLIREGETACAQELADFGLEPPLLRVVRATPRLVEPPIAVGGEALSKLKSVEVISIWLDPAAPASYRLSLRNLSPKDIAAIEIYESVEGRGGGGSLTMRAGPTRPLIAAGGRLETHVGGGGSSGRMTPQGFVPDPPRAPTFVVGTVVFADGTYEGEAEVAARMEGREAGRRFQLECVVSLLKALRESLDLDQKVAIKDLKERVSNLRIDVNPALTNSLLARFPLTGDEQKRELTAQVMNGLRGGREEVLRAIEEYEQLGAHSPDGGDLRAWLSRTEERYEAVVRGR